MTRSGTIRELTWNRPLPDGGKLIDVMSPSVSLDGRRVYFSGRREGERFRLYAISLDGSDLRPITGGANDRGCVATPPARFAHDGRSLSDAERRSQDYDDVDPSEVPGGAIVFSSSRMPDLGGRDLRATQLWVLPPNQPPRQLTASRANDRWPFVTQGLRVVFSLWSHVDEVISADGKSLILHDPANPGLTRPVNNWMAADVYPNGYQFSGTVKIATPVWRPRPLPNGKIVFMTPAPDLRYTANPESAAMTLIQADPGTATHAPSSLAADATHPAPNPSLLAWSANRTDDGREWSMATPTPYREERILVSAAPLMADQRPNLLNYGIYHLNQDGWTAHREGTADLQLLFDDPNFVDAEPVAVYPRTVPKGDAELPPKWPADQKHTIALAKDNHYTGIAGFLHSTQLMPRETMTFHGQTTDAGTSPIIPPFPEKSIDRIVFFASRRDRFDDPDQPVIRGRLELLMSVPVQANNDQIEATLPVGDPTLLIGVGKDGRVASVMGAADAANRRGKFYAYAGDHVSGIKAGGYHFCTGCHAGHTFHGNDLTEKIK